MKTAVLGCVVAAVGAVAAVVGAAAAAAAVAASVWLAAADRGVAVRPCRVYDTLHGRAIVTMASIHLHTTDTHFGDIGLTHCIRMYVSLFTARYMGA